MSVKKKSIDTEIAQSIFEGKPVTKEQVSVWLRRDIEGCYVLLMDILNSPLVYEAILNSFYAKYEKMRQDIDAEKDVKKEEV